MAEKATAAEGARSHDRGAPGPKLPWKIDQSALDIAVPLLEPGDAQKHAAQGSKSGSGRWSHWDEIGWVHYPEIGWSHSDEIRGVQSHEILHDVGESNRPDSSRMVFYGSVEGSIISRWISDG